MKLIMVEGIPGSGKSTTARFIALQSERNGNPTKLLHESAYQHPILNQETIHDPNVWMDTYLSNLDRFLNEQRDTESIVVMESVLFQAPILHLLHMDLEREKIVTFIEAICARLKGTDCSLVYLYQEDPMTGIHRLMNDRGGRDWLTSNFEKYKHEPYYVNRGWSHAESHLDFLHDYAVIARSAYARCHLRSLSIDNTDWNWTAYYTEILDAFGWDYVPDPVVPHAELIPYAGIYRNDEMNLTTHVAVKEGHLIIFGDHRLKVKETDTFYLDRVSIVVSFIRDHTGEFHAFIVSEKDLAGNRKEEGTRFVRISWD